MTHKQLSVRIGYTDYLIHPEDAINLLQIAQRMHALKRGHYNDPYDIDTEAEPFVQAAEMVEVRKEADAERPDKFTTATRDALR